MSDFTDDLEHGLGVLQASCNYVYRLANEYIHVDINGNRVDVRTIDDRYKRNLYGWYLRRIEVLDYMSPGRFSNTKLFRYLKKENKKWIDKKL